MTVNPTYMQLEMRRLPSWSKRLRHRHRCRHLSCQHPRPLPTAASQEPRRCASRAAARALRSVLRPARGLEARGFVSFPCLSPRSNLHALSFLTARHRRLESCRHLSRGCGARRTEQTTCASSLTCRQMRQGWRGTGCGAALPAFLPGGSCLSRSSPAGGAAWRQLPSASVSKQIGFRLGPNDGVWPRPAGVPGGLYVRAQEAHAAAGPHVR